jgi:hypothetical protein
MNKETKKVLKDFLLDKVGESGVVDIILCYHKEFIKRREYDRKIEKIKSKLQFDNIEIKTTVKPNKIFKDELVKITTTSTNKDEYDKINILINKNYEQYISLNILYNGYKLIYSITENINREFHLKTYIHEEHKIRMLFDKGDGFHEMNHGNFLYDFGVIIKYINEKRFYKLFYSIIKILELID